MICYGIGIFWAVCVLYLLGIFRRVLRRENCCWRYSLIRGWRLKLGQRHYAIPSICTAKFHACLIRPPNPPFKPYWAERNCFGQIGIRLCSKHDLRPVTKMSPMCLSAIQHHLSVRYSTVTRPFRLSIAFESSCELYCHTFPTQRRTSPWRNFGNIYDLVFRSPLCKERRKVANFTGILGKSFRNASLVINVRCRPFTFPRTYGYVCKRRVFRIPYFLRICVIHVLPSRMKVSNWRASSE